MRRTLILTLAVLACALALCAASRAALNEAVSGARTLGLRAMQALEQDRTADARALSARLEEYWQARSGLLELLTGHDALREAADAVADARICLACEDRDDFLRAMAAALDALDRLEAEQAASWGNLF